ncbi:MAG: chemotaxis protein CheX [Candidatus Solibacter sp.]
MEHPMPEVFRIDTYREDLGRIAHDIFETMLGVEVEAAGQEWQPARDRLTGAVYLAGAWRGAVLLECDRAQACDFTRRLMAVPRPEKVDDDVRDTIGELANMIGGNLKSVLPRGVVLSMPSVVEGGDYCLRFCAGNALLERMAYRSPAGVFWITLVEIPDA